MGGVGFSQKMLIFFVFLHKNMLCGLIRSASQTHNMFSWRSKKTGYMVTPFSCSV